MANTKVNDVVSIDSTGDLSALIGNSGWKVNAMTVIGSGDTWLVDIQATEDGQSMFYASSDIANERTKHLSFPNGVHVTSLFVKTLTDITKVLLYVHSKGLN